MVIAQALMGVESTAYVKAFTVMIQFGAILSVVALYFNRFFTFMVPDDMRGGTTVETISEPFSVLL